jgi:hypothetical protein
VLQNGKKFLLHMWQNISTISIYKNVYEWMSEWLLFNAKWAILSAISWQEQVLFNKMIMIYVLY